ncbi:hypothetical protein [Noviherbaspirillum saxi]|nr:hypothetical protein [Noviherbaspirillum saxi]
MMDSSAGVTDQLLRFRDNGVQVALDDFATGFLPDQAALTLLPHA